MKDIIAQLESIIRDYEPRLEKAEESGFGLKPLPHKWSKKEILGHLVDSAQNNIRRFIVAQYEDQPQIVYKQDHWVAISNYQNYNKNDLVKLWSLLNKHICIILGNISSDTAKREVRTEALHSIQWLAADYNKHLLHHLHQVLELEPVAYP